MRAKYQLAKSLQKVFPSPPQSIWPLAHLQFLTKELQANEMRATLVFNKLFSTYGDTYLLNIGLLTVVLTRDLNLAKFVIQNDPEKFMKGNKEGLFYDTFQQSIIHTEGQQWYQKRQLMKHAFSKKALESFIPTFHKSAQELGTVWKKSENKDMDITELFTRLTMDVIGRVGIGYDFEAQIKPGRNLASQDFYAILEGDELFSRNPLNSVLGLTYFKNFTTPGKKYVLAIGRIRKAVNEILEARLKQQSSLKNNQQANLLSYLIESTAVNQEIKLTNEELVSEVTLFFIAGHETTSALLSWTLYYLSKYPQIRERVLQELKEVEAPTDESAPPWSVVNHLPYLTQVLKETLRLRGPVPGFIRATINEEVYNGMTLPVGTPILVHGWSIHRDPRHWAEPVEEFNPDQFSPENSKNRNLLAFQPFATGPRNCLGMQFAMLEARTVLTYLLPRFQFQLVGEPSIKESILMRAQDLRMKVKPL